MSETHIDDQKAAAMLLILAGEMRMQDKAKKAQACEWAAARLMSIPTLASQMNHPSISSKAEAMDQIVRFIVDGVTNESQ